MDDCNHVMEGWEWDSFFASSFLEQEAGTNTLQCEFGEPEPTVPTYTAEPPTTSVLPFDSHLAHNSTTQLGASIKARVGKASNSTPAFSSNGTNTSDGSFESSDCNQDTPSTTHLLLSDVLPDNSASVVATTKNKKKKRDPRLECPNFLAGRIPCSCPEDDELEEDVEEQVVVKKRSKVGSRCQVPSCSGDISHLKGYHQRHRVCLGCANSPQVLLKDQPHRYCQQCGKFHRLSDFDEGKRSCRRKLERHNRRRRRRPLEEEENVQDVGVLACEIENDNIAVDYSTQAGLDLENLVIDDQLDDSSASALRSEQVAINTDKSALEEQPWLTMLRDNVTEGVEIDPRNVTELYIPKPELPRAAHLPTNARRYAEYTSPCPTGRVSFKLYDWNPADFPRRLRQLIFQWLANMPVELEAYIRSGCIILTFFIASPQVTWDKIMDEWTGQIQKLLLWSGQELWGTSHIIAPHYEKSLYVRDGKVINADNYKRRSTPYLLDLYPLSLEAGCHTHIYVSGFNFDGARFFLSFGEHYLECSDCEPVNYHHFSLRSVWKTVDNLEFWKVSVFLPNSQKFGPAYLEVDNDHGVSNFMPLLVADKDVCAEINASDIGWLPSAAVSHNVISAHSISKYSKTHSTADILSDLGWTFRYICKYQAINYAEVPTAFMERLQRLLTFCLEHGWHVVAKRLVQTALTSGVIQNMSFISARYRGLYIFNTIEPVRVVRGIPFFKQLPVLNLMDEHYKSLPEAATRREFDSSFAVALSSHHKAINGSIQTAAKPRQFAMGSLFLDDDIPVLKNGWKLKIGCWVRSLAWSKLRADDVPRPLFSGSRRLCRMIVMAASIVTVCTGMCFMLQHPREVVEISMSVRRCLWGSGNIQHG